MIRNPKDLARYDAHERANHWLVGISFILLALSGLAFFHPAFYPLVQLFGGGVWARILHPGPREPFLVRRRHRVERFEAEEHHQESQRHEDAEVGVQDARPDPRCV